MDLIMRQELKRLLIFKMEQLLEQILKVFDLMLGV